jgi:hypothetical protein
MTSTTTASPLGSDGAPLRGVGRVNLRDAYAGRVHEAPVFFSTSSSTI